MSAPDERAGTEAIPHEAVEQAAPTRPGQHRLLVAAAVIVAALLPLFATNFVLFQLTLVMVYGLAILGLNINDERVPANTQRAACAYAPRERGRCLFRLEIRGNLDKIVRSPRISSGAIIEPLDHLKDRAEIDLVAPPVQLKHKAQALDRTSLPLEQLPMASNYPLPVAPVRRIRNLGLRREDWPESRRRTGQQLLNVVG